MWYTENTAFSQQGLTPFILSFFFRLFSISCSDLFLPSQCTCRGLLLHLITLKTHTHTQVTRTRTPTRCMTPLDKWSAHRRDLYRTTHNTHNRQTALPSAGFEPKVPARERPQNYPLGLAATGVSPLNTFSTTIVVSYENHKTLYIRSVGEVRIFLWRSLWYVQ